MALIPRLVKAENMSAGHRRLIAVLALTCAALAPIAPTPLDAPPAAVAAASSAPLTGVDISWPQCPKGMGIPSRPTEGKPMPKKSARFVVVG